MRTKTPVQVQASLHCGDFQLLACLFDGQQARFELAQDDLGLYAVGLEAFTAVEIETVVEDMAHGHIDPRQCQLDACNPLTEP